MRGEHDGQEGEDELLSALEVNECDGHARSGAEGNPKKRLNVPRSRGALRLEVGSVASKVFVGGEEHSDEGRDLEHGKRRDVERDNPQGESCQDGKKRYPDEQESGLARGRLDARRVGAVEHGREVVLYPERVEIRVVAWHYERPFLSVFTRSDSSSDTTAMP